MYLAQKKSGGRVRYCLRESLVEDHRLTYRELFDLGPTPETFIIYPGGNGFYFNQDLVNTLTDLGVVEVDRELERLFIRFLDPQIKRIIIQMLRLGRPRRKDLSPKAMFQAQDQLHDFDRRRLYFLRYGRMDRPEFVRRPQKIYNQLLEKSRDELEHFFQELEVGLRTWENKEYVFRAFHLGRHFRDRPLADLNPTELDERFLDELCCLNLDPTYLNMQPGETSPIGSLSEYLTPYVVYWFDYEFGQRDNHDQVFEEFIHRIKDRPPRPKPRVMDSSAACRVFGLSSHESHRLTRDELSRLYRRLALHYHPDHGGDQEKFIELNLAYQCLVAEK